MAGFGKGPFGISRAIAPGAPPTEPPPVLPPDVLAAIGSGLELGDYELSWSNGEIDMSIVDDDVSADEGLRTALLLSLFTDRRAEDEDTLPDGSGDRRGWWADELAEHVGDRYGSRLWLLDRSKGLAEVVPQAEEYAREALAWLLEDKVSSRVDVAAEVNGPVLALVVTIHRPERDPATFRFEHVWDGEARR